jgi:hypothetical protein
MAKRIGSLVAGLIALITFLAVGDRMVWDSQCWECLCTNDECDMCATPNWEYTLSDEAWDMAWENEKYDEALNEFDAIFAAVEFKVAKNGRSMVKGIHAKSFKFAAK